MVEGYISMLRHSMDQKRFVFLLLNQQKEACQSKSGSETPMIEIQQLDTSIHMWLVVFFVF